MDQAKSVKADGFVHWLVFQYGPFSWRSRVSDCRLFWMAVASFLCLLVHPLYAWRGVRRFTTGAALAAWVGAHIYWYNIVWIVLSNSGYAKGAAALVELGFSPKAAFVIAAVVSLEKGILLVVAILLCAVATVVGLTLGLLWMCDHGWLDRIGSPDKALDRFVRRVGDLLPERKRRVKKEETHVSWKDRWPRTAAFLGAASDLLEVVLDWIVAKKEKVCKVREVERLPA